MSENPATQPPPPRCPRCKLPVKADAEFCKHCGAKVGEHKLVPWWHVHRRLYDWTLAWAYRPSAAVALFALSFFESIIGQNIISILAGIRSRWRCTTTAQH